MSTLDDPHGLSPLRPGQGIQPAYPIDDLKPDAVGTAAKPFTLKLVVRAICRYWWQALTVWVVGSTAMMVVAYYKVKPTYQAFSQIRIEPGELKIFSNAGGQKIDFDEFKETQVKIMTGPTVLSAALAAHPELLGLPMLRQAEDPEIEIRQNLGVMIVPKTNLIQVSMSSEFANEAVQIVNAVVEAYIKSAGDSNDEANEARIAKLREIRDTREEELKRRRAELADLQKKITTVNADGLKELNALTIESYAQLSNELVKIRIQRIAADAYYNQVVNDRGTAVARQPDPRGPTEQIVMLFNADPKVREMKDRAASLESKLVDLEKRVRNKMDPAIRTPRRQIDTINTQLRDMWGQMKPQLEAQIRQQEPSGDSPTVLNQADARLKELQAQENALEEQLRAMRINNQAAGGELLRVGFLESDVQRAERIFSTIQDTLDQAEFESRNPVARINLQFKAKPSNRPSTNNRFKVMALAPFCMLLAVAGLLVLMEKQAARVADPDELPGRLHLQVLGVVPPLPQVRPGANGYHDLGGDLPPGGGDYRAQRQLDEFVQSLDHLRVALVNGRGPHGRERRCILITSACGSEGKTTLAAQLAERCVNAGLMTLLIDADLRNPTLSRVLDVPDGRGLINVLRDEITIEEALTVIGGAGGFHLLPAGTPRVDPSRLLQGSRLGKVLAQVRESFDIVIVDAPPVLPVPDALTIGRWVDGAVLAVRYDTSRFPMVERANQRLASVGVPVLGAVVNGVKPSNSAYYGGYYYSSSSLPSDDTAMLDV